MSYDESAKKHDGCSPHPNTSFVTHKYWEAYNARDSWVGQSCNHAATPAILDTGATDHFFPATYVRMRPRQDHDPIHVGCPNGTTMQLVGKDVLNIEGLPERARECHIFQDIDKALISIPKLCTHGCTATQDEECAVVCGPAGGVVLEGH